MMERFPSRKSGSTSEPRTKDMRTGASREEPTLLSRRQFLRAAVGGVAVTASGEALLRAKDFVRWRQERGERMRFDRWEGLSPREREERIDAEVRHSGAFIQSGEGRRVLESGSNEELFKLLQLMPPILREHIDGTRYEIPRSEWPSINIGGTFDGDVPRIETAAGYEGPARSWSLAESGYGNGFFVDERSFLTNIHVLAQGLVDHLSHEKNRAVSEVRTYNRLMRVLHEDNLDIVRVVVPADRNVRSRVLPLGSMPKSADVHGSFVRVAGIDPDQRAAADGTKIYPSIAIRATRRLADFIAAHAAGGYAPFAHGDRLFGNSFVLLMPPGETIAHPPASATGSRLVDLVLDEPVGSEQMYHHGMSGSPALTAEGTLAGIFYGGLTVSYGGRCTDIGFFLGPDEIRRSQEIGMTYDVEKFRGAAERGQ